VLALIASAVLILPHLGSHADAVNMNCTLLVPANPLTATGLATPYQLSATDQANGACNENNINQSAFVQGDCATQRSKPGKIAEHDCSWKSQR
jgi:hypothetical protein